MTAAEQNRTAERRMRPVSEVRVPPNDLRAEVELLGAMLLDEHAAAEGLTLCSASDFYGVSGGHVASAIGAVVGRGEVADSHAVTAELRRAGVLDSLSVDGSEGAAVIVTLVARAGMRYQVKSLASTVAKYARARAVIAKAATLADAGYAADLEQGAAVAAEVVEDLGAIDARGSTWSPVDVGAVIDGGLEMTEPTLLLRSDGSGLLYPGKVHAINAPPETAKTFLALYVAFERISAGEHVVYIDFEDDALGILERLMALGVSRDEAASQFHYVRPDEPFSPTARAQLLNLVRLHQPTLAIIDGVAEAMAQNGWNESDNGDVAAFLTALPRLLEREGCSVVLLDHLVKDKEQQGRYARGAGHKLAGLSGAAYKMETLSAFGRGKTGSVRLTLTKDRPGWIRRSAAGQKVAEVEFASSANGDSVVVKVSAPDTTPQKFRPTYLMEHVSRVLEIATAPMSMSQVLESTNGNRDARISAIRCLVDEGYLEVSRAGQAHLHRSERPFRQAAEVPATTIDQPDSGDF